MSGPRLIVANGAPPNRRRTRPAKWERKRMPRMNGGEAVVEAIKAAGISHMFGLLGSSTMEVYDALYGCKEIKYVGVRGDRPGNQLAAAFGRVPGKPDVVPAMGRASCGERGCQAVEVP